MSKKLLLRFAVLLAAMMCALGAAAAEAYACYTSSNTTLTFYYDNQRASRTGTTYDLNEGDNYTEWETEGTSANVTKVVFDPSFAGARPTTTCDWFYGMWNLESITGMSYLNTSEVTNMAWMFMECCKLTSLDVSHFNTSKVTYMNKMFADCEKLTSLDLSGFNTSKVTHMTYMFDGSSNLRTIYVGSGWSTAAVTNSVNMFNNCTSLVGGKGTTYNSNHIDKTYAHIDGGTSNPGYFTRDPNSPELYACYTPSNTTLTFYYDNYRSSRTGTTYDLNEGDNYTEWETDGTNANVTKVVFDPSFAGARPTTTCDWFYGMWNLESITGMSYLNTSEVTNMAWMFMECCKLTSLDVSHFNTSKVTYMNKMFADCEKLTSLDLSSFNTANLTNMTGMFDGCSALTSLDVSGFNTSNVTYMSYMFHSCSALTSLDVSGFNTSKVTHMTYMFDGSSNLRTIYVGSGWSTAAVTNSVNMFNNCTSLVGGKGTTYDANHVDKAYAHIDGGSSNPGYFTDINAARAYACYTPSNTTLTFYYDDQRSSRPGTTYDLNTGENYPGWYTDGTKSNVTQVVFDPSFSDALPVSTHAWFRDMRILTSITNIENLNTSSVTNMGRMFMNCNYLTSIDVSHFDTNNVTNMQNMFFNCYRLTDIDLSKFNTSLVTNMFAMFQDCMSITSMDLSSFNTANVNDMRSMFSGCDGLTSLDLTSFNTANVTRTGSMFSYSNALTTIYVGSGWSTAAVTSSSDMFYDCTSLVGGQGTAYSSSNPTDKTYAHIDGGPSNPGYFTEKPAFQRGDVNGDGSVNISDVTALIDYLLSGNASGINLSGADCNQDSSVNISDVTALIDYLLSGTWN